MRNVLIDMAWIFLFCTAIFPVFGEEDPEWLYQDGLITAGEFAEQSLQPQNQDETAWKGRTAGRISSQSDTNAHFRAPIWSSTSRWNKLHGSVSGDSSLRLWQVSWKDSPWTCGGGFWKGTDLSLAYPDSSRLGGWCDWKPSPLRVAFAGAEDSSGLLLLGWEKGKERQVEMAYKKSPTEDHLIIQGAEPGIQYSLLKPIHLTGAVVAGKLSSNSGQDSHVLATATWNSTDTATKDLSAKILWKKEYGLWKIHVENRWNQYTDSLTEWIYLASCQKDTERSSFLLSYSVRNEPDNTPSQFLRLGSEWGFQNSPWSLFSVYQWRPASHAHWQIEPQLESGVRFVENRKQKIRLSIALPPEYRSKQIAQMRFTAEAPIADAASLKFRWTANLGKEQYQPMQRIKLFLAISWKL